VIKEVNTLRLDGGRAGQHRRQRQGNKGRKKRRGRPSKQAHKPKQSRQGTSQKEQAPFLWDHQDRIVRTDAALREQDTPDLALLLPIAPALKLLREFHQQLYRLLARGMTKQGARYRRRRLVNQRQYHANAFLAKALKKLSPDKFDQMMVFLGGENGERTNKQVERQHRGFRMMPKTRSKRRKAHPLEKALELALSARMSEQPLYRHNVRELPVHLQETAILKMAA
jgi:hypothetical protein